VTFKNLVHAYFMHANHKIALGRLALKDRKILFEYEPELENDLLSNLTNLDEMAKGIMQFQENDNDHFVDDFLGLNSSSARAHPKIVIRLIDEVKSTVAKWSNIPKDLDVSSAFQKMIQTSLDQVRDKL
jgi:hypothetical protein